MKKSTIWLIVGVMIFAFAGLMYLQIDYLKVIAENRSSQFRESVRLNLLQVSRSLELDETSRLFDGILANTTDTQEQLIRYAEKLKSKNITIPDKVTFNRRKSDLRTESRSIQDDLYERYLYYENLLSEVIRTNMKANELPIEERVDFDKIKVYIQTELANNNLALPFLYAISDRNGNLVFKSPGFRAQNSGDAFKQTLFPKDPPNKLFTLQVYFPTIKDYVYSLETIRLIVPSIVFTFALLLAFVVTIYIILRQKKLSEMKSDFISNMTHELKTPVTTISMAGQMLSDKDMVHKMLGQISRTVTDETKRLQFLIDKVLQMSLVEDGRSVMKIREVDVNDVLLNVAQLFDIQVKSRKGSLTLALDATESLVYVDEMHFTNVLFNLMENAVKYSKEDVPPILKVKTWNDRENIMISISDNGIGIKRDNLKKIFDRFYRVSRGNIHDVKGFGLGLAYVKKIIDGLGGTIKVESEYKAGTTFTIILPYIQ
ncbi:MAG: HAMP domain-containing histidine kinase [Dysgonamonadaceae bacterium]|jgi:two-component sensor histidine kinase|nr:HAMP domain-containing histidine kinase [Dysgonamonadaceae bacterium]